MADIGSPQTPEEQIVAASSPQPTPTTVQEQLALMTAQLVYIGDTLSRLIQVTTQQALLAEIDSAQDVTMEGALTIHQLLRASHLWGIANTEEEYQKLRAIVGIPIAQPEPKPKPNKNRKPHGGKR